MCKGDCDNQGHTMSLIQAALSNLRKEITSPHGTTTGALRDLEAIAIYMNDRIEKMEKALSEEMAKTREMDDILAGVVKRVGHPSEAMEDDFKAELLKWLDIEIAMAEENLEQANRAHMVVATAKMQAMLATYKAVKAHIQG